MGRELARGRQYGSSRVHRISSKSRITMSENFAMTGRLAGGVFYSFVLSPPPFKIVSTKSNAKRAFLTPLQKF